MSNRQEAERLFYSLGTHFINGTIKESCFWSLVPITQVLDTTRRTLGDIAVRMKKLDFRDLSVIERPHNKEWYDSCQNLYDSWDMSQFKPLLLVPINDIFKHGSYGIRDGCHSSLALAMLIKRGKLKYIDIPVVFSSTRMSFE